ncbi:hypothetical protein CHS0354_019713 [Potamilus streckersoni]|uniref:UBC core domain-containing protein n=1 Tax=Potamilus streckersoni TaxID=2493646 RepID=A0AAE0S9P4_9BIVA|nr:hypothetical protein CHS0354_019713 [Potamilus streckersoni]
MSVNLQRKNAMKRLALDLAELQTNVVENVSAAPLDENMFEWHCNFQHDDIIYHLILFFPEKYPYDSPSAEFVPAGFRYNSGATMPGKKGTKVCLNIFADFAYVHTEWKDQKGLGWSPGYTVQTILLNVVAFLAETQSGESSWMKDTAAHNKKLSENFTCDCGHTYKKPFPPLALDTKGNKGPTGKGKSKGTEAGHQIIDYMSKVKMQKTKPKSADNLYGYGLVVSGPNHRPSLTTPCEFLTLESFEGMKTAMGKVHSVMKEEIKYFLPMYIHPIHGSEIKETFENTLKEIAVILPKCNPKKTPIEQMVIKVIPNLMSATVVDFSKGTQHTSDNSLNGYFALHRLFLWALETYPEMEKIVDNQLKEFIENEDKRTKKACPHIGEWLMLLSGSWKYRWQNASNAYLSESWRRNVMWYVKEDAKLGFLDTDQKYRLENTLMRTEVSRKLLAFQVLFLDIAMPNGKSRKELIQRYDDNLGFPTPEMVAEMKNSVDRIKNMKTYADWYSVLKLKPLSNDEIFNQLVKALQYAIKTDGYYWSFWKEAGGWTEVLKRYPKEKKGAKADKDDGGEGSSGKGKGRKKSEGESDKAQAKGKGRGKKAAVEEEKDDEVEEEEEEKVKPAKGRGKGKKASVKVEKVEKDVKPAKGRGRGKRGAAVIKVDEEKEEEEVKPAKGRGRGKRKAEEAFGASAAKAGKGGKRKR